MKSEYVRFRKTIGMRALFEKSYKNTRTKKEAALTGGLFFGMSVGLERSNARVRWTLARRVGPRRLYSVPSPISRTYRSLWESPSDLRRIRYGCGSNSSMSDPEKPLVRGTPPKNRKYTRTMNRDRRIQIMANSTTPVWDGAAVITGSLDLGYHQVCRNGACTAGQRSDRQCSGSSLGISNR